MLTRRDNFIKMAREIPFINDELRKANPRFNLEWNNGNSKFKYIVIQTMFEIYCTMAETTEEQQKTISKLEYKLKGIEESKVVDEVLSETTKPLENTLNTEDTEVTTFYPLQPTHMDRWAPFPEVGRIMYFESMEERGKFLFGVAQDRAGTAVPDEYTSYDKLPPVKAPKGYRENYTQYVCETPRGTLTYFVE